MTVPLLADTVAISVTVRLSPAGMLAAVQSNGETVSAGQFTPVPPAMDTNVSPVPSQSRIVTLLAAAAPSFLAVRV